jgi:hypothetical protein
MSKRSTEALSVVVAKFGWRKLFANLEQVLAPAD